MSWRWKSLIDRLREQVEAIVHGPGRRGRDDLKRAATKAVRPTQTFGMTPAEYAEAVKRGLNPRDWTEP